MREIEKAAVKEVKVTVKLYDEATGTTLGERYEYVEVTEGEEAKTLTAEDVANLTVNDVEYEVAADSEKYVDCTVVYRAEVNEQYWAVPMREVKKADTKEITVTFRDADGNIIGEPIVVKVPADAQEVDLTDVIPDGYEAGNPVAVINEDGTVEFIIEKIETPAPEKEYKDVAVTVKDKDGNVIKETVVTVEKDAAEVDLTNLIPDGYKAENPVAAINEDGTVELVVEKIETPTPEKEYKDVAITVKDKDGTVLIEKVVTVEKDAAEIDLKDLIPDGYETENPVVVINEEGTVELIVEKIETPAPEDEYADAVLNVTYVNTAGAVIGPQTLTKNGKVGENAVFVRSDLSAPNGYRIPAAAEDITVAYGTSESANVTVTRNSSGGSGSGGGSSSGSSGASSNTLVGGEWRLDEVGWWYPYSNGTYAKGGWYQLIWKGVHEWYYFNETGYLISGWYTDTDGNKYYLHPLHDGDFGRMYTGWNLVDGNWEFFNDNAEAGKLGAWVEGKEVPAELQQ